VCSGIYGQSLNNNWDRELSSTLQQFISCENAHGDRVECNKYVGESLKTVYNLNDFYSQKLGRHLMVSEIAKMLGESNQWTMLGHGYEQKALSEAQNIANAKKAVVAVYMNAEGIGHLALILPGELQQSGSWGLTVPNSASFQLADPDKSYINKALSYAFAKNHLKDVVLYTRNY
jgi:hypothetical protein